jgi:hypothetical protein
LVKLKEPQNHMNPVRRILILSANPKTTSRLRLNEEVREIKEGLRRSKYRDQFLIHSICAVSQRDMRRALLDYDPHFVHFTGLGNESGLFVVDELGMALHISTDALAGLFKLFSDRVECVFLSACHSAWQARAISKHIKYVIGMRKEIKDKAAIEFAVGFYDALGAGRSVEDAFQFGCNAILQMFPNLSEHLIPVLKKRKDIFYNDTPDHTQAPGKIYRAALKAHNGKYVTAVSGGGGKLIARSEEIEKWEVFHFIELSEREVNIQVHNGQYVRAEGDGRLKANRSSPQAYETFNIFYLPGNEIALKAHNGLCVSPENDETGELVAKQARIRDREFFTLEKL